ncbi:hypothetical protein, partial [Caldifermentibacillus hisashii]
NHDYKRLFPETEKASMYAPKQRGKLKEQLRYIGRYIRRPAIGM